jgi:hypothetical protein
MLHSQPFTADNGLSAGHSRSRRVEQPDDLARNNTYGGSHWHRPMDVLWADTAFDAVSLPCRTSHHATVEGRVIMGRCDALQLRVPLTDPLAGRMVQVRRARRPELDSHTRKDSLRGQPRVGCRPTDPRRHPRGVGGTDHGNRALTGEYRDGQRHPAHRTRDARLAPHLLDETAFIESCLLGGTASPSPWTAASVPHPAGVVGPHRDLDPVAGADLGQQARDVGLGGR